MIPPETSNGAQMVGMKKSRSRAIPFLVLVVILLGVAVHQLRGNGDPADGDFTVLTQNIGDLCGCSTFDAILENFRKLPHTDILMLQEVKNKKRVSRIADSLGYPHHAFAGYGGHRNDGMAILSDHPLVDPRPLLLPASQDQQRCLLARVSIRGREVLAGSVHFRNIGAFPVKACTHTASTERVVETLWRETFFETPRSVSARDLVSAIESAHAERVVLGGDFNTVISSRAIRTMAGYFKDSLWPSLEYLRPSYKKFSFPVGPRVDYVFYAGSLECLGSRIIPETAGDHYPVTAVFRF